MGRPPVAAAAALCERTPEPGRDVLDADAVLVQPVEGGELVRRVHVLAHDVLGQACLGPVDNVCVQHAAGASGAFRDPLLLGQQFQGGQPAPAGDNLVAVARRSALHCPASAGPQAIAATHVRPVPRCPN